MFKNTASQKVIFFAFDATTNVPKTGDAANITPYVSKDYGSVTAMTDTSATEMDATNAPGYYLVDISQTETNADTLLLSAKSATANIKVIGAPAIIFTYPTGGIASPTNITAAAGCAVSSLGAGVVTAASIASAALTAAKFAADTGLVPVASGTASSGSTTTIALAGASATDGFYINMYVLATGGTGAGQGGIINAYVGATKVATLNTAVPTAFDATTTWVVLALPGAINTVTGNVAGSVGSVTGAVGSVTGAVGSVTGNVGGNVTGSVGSVTGAVGSVTGAVGSVTGAVGSVTGLTASNLDATISSRATPTNITAGTITTVTNLTNAPTVGDLTAAMKTSVATAASNRVQKNTALAGFQFFMRDSTTHAAATGLTITAKRSLDGGALGACANSATEISLGWYTIDLAAADLNGNNVALLFTSAGADDCNIRLVTQPT